MKCDGTNQVPSTVPGTFNAPKMADAATFMRKKSLATCH